MKFCKNLQRVVDTADPSWSPYWTNYKMLKKLIKELASTLNGPTNGASSGRAAVFVDPVSVLQQPHHGGTDAANLGQSPGELAFFRLLHEEFRKVSHFFGNVQKEFCIREERIKVGAEIMKKPEASMIREKWYYLTRSVYRLYKDLLLLETFAIMTYCSFSKILKKHDKVTGHQTRNAFMLNVVNKANFNQYPELLAMIQRCEILYEEVSRRLIEDGIAFSDLEMDACFTLSLAAQAARLPAGQC